MDPARVSRRSRRWLAGLALVAAATLTTPAAALAAEAPTREEYVGQLEGICRPDSVATQRAMKGARGDISAERLTIASVKFAKAEAIFGSTLKEIAAVPRPVADTAELREWFAYLKRQNAYLKRITTELRLDRALTAQRLIARFIHNGNLANYAVLEFGFHHCSFKFARYG
jgi:hypothetical protein